jgi:hypothetical protein
MGTEFISDVLQPLAIFGGIAMIVWASAKAKLEHRKLDMRQGQPLEMRPVLAEDRVLAELKAMQQHMAEMQNTSHQFDLSFDAALNRLEERISRVEAKPTAPPVRSFPELSQEEPLQRNGLG